MSYASFFFYFSFLPGLVSSSRYSEGSNLTPAHHYPDFRFKTYAPLAFRYFRDLFGIKPDDYLVRPKIFPTLQVVDDCFFFVFFLPRQIRKVCHTTKTLKNRFSHHLQLQFSASSAHLESKSFIYSFQNSSSSFRSDGVCVCVCKH